METTTTKSLELRTEPTTTTTGDVSTKAIETGMILFIDQVTADFFGKY